MSDKRGKTFEECYVSDEEIQKFLYIWDNSTAYDDTRLEDLGVTAIWDGTEWINKSVSEYEWNILSGRTWSKLVNEIIPRRSQELQEVVRNKEDVDEFLYGPYRTFRMSNLYTTEPDPFKGEEFLEEM